MKITDKSTIYALLLYILFSLVLTYPLISGISTHLGADSGDGWQNVWNLWWMKKAVTELRTSPFFTAYLHHPLGTDLSLHTLNPFNGLISIPLQYFFNLITTYNIIELFSFVMTGLGMFLLVRHLTKNRPVSFVSGLLFTFSPYHFAHADGHLHLVAMEWIPFYVLYFIKIFDEPRLKNSVLAALFLVLNGLCTAYYALYCIIFSLVHIAWKALSERKIAVSALKHLLICFSIFSLLFSPVLITMLRAGASPIKGSHDPVAFSADLESFVIPSKYLVMGKFFSSVTSRFTGDPHENANFMGWIVTLLVLFLFIKERTKETLFWFLSAFLFFLFSLGPHPHIGGRVFDTIPLPYLILDRTVPLFSASGVPSRFIAMLNLCILVLAAYSLDLITRKTKIRPILFAILSAVMLFEYLDFPFTTYAYPVPSFYRRIAEDRGSYALMDLTGGACNLYYQTIHQKPIVGGYTSRISDDRIAFLENTPVINALYYDMKLIVPEGIDAPAIARDILEKYNVRYVIIDARDFARKEMLRDQFRLPVVFNGEGIEVYEAFR